MTCPICNDTGFQVVDAMWGKMSLPCHNPECPKSIAYEGERVQSPKDVEWSGYSTLDRINPQQPKLKPRTKTTHIPQKEYFNPEVNEVYFLSYVDEITTTTIEDILK